MKLDWKALAARIDDMSLRERGMLFASACLVILVLAHVLLIEPMLRGQKALIDRTTRNHSQINAVRSQIQQIGQPAQDVALHPELKALERRIEEANRAMGKRQRQFVAPERLPALLRELLGANREVQVVALKLLPGMPVQPAGGELHRHGVELTVRGSYFDLLRYLEDLENLPSLLLWGKATLDAEHYPEVRLTVVVQTLSRQRNLL
jgi:MSHA biogenesis protein MshJ